MTSARQTSAKESEAPRSTNLADAWICYASTYPPTVKSVGLARREVVAFARTCGFADQALNDIEVAVGEALANAVEHGRRDDSGHLEVSVHRDARSLVVEIKDNGHGFDHYRRFVHTRPPAEALRGFGTFIMSQLMDEMAYSDGGTRLRLVKHLPTHGTALSA